MKKFLYKLNFINLILLFVVTGCNQPTANQYPTLTPIVFPTTTFPALLPSTETPQIEPASTLTPAPEPNEVPSFTPLPLPTNTVCSPPAGWPTYIVQSGENLFRIALRYNMGAADLQSANCLPSADTIFAGQTIYVPYTIPPTSAPPTSVLPTKVQTVLPPDLKQKVGLDTGGEPGAPDCTPATTTITPQITISEKRVNSMYALCVYDFPMDEPLTVDLYAPDGNWVASKTYPKPGVLGTRTLIKIRLWMPVGTLSGLWHATVTATNITLENQPFLISPITEMAINTMPTGPINPFETEKICGVYARGADVVVRGVNFGSSPNLPIGIYLYTSDIPKVDGKYDLPFIRSQSVPVNGGNFSTTFRVELPDLAGTYWVLPILNLDQPDYQSFDIKNDCYKVE